jgi:hypothetical protein
MPLFEYVGPYDEVIVPTVGLVKKGEPVDLSPDLAEGVSPELFKKTNKKTAKAVVETPAVNESEPVTETAPVVVETPTLPPAKKWTPKTAKN